ncbi:MAG: glycine--tRNA ligase [Chloroflexi bacterium]|nr:MAG: glycine--tRNA ligase [Chloroflexota bacterium]TMB94449.1 MAG: glycine--tRNA ligase [Chloroflexota bacterium]TMC35127.1 MAG: glycine--tRNA ligase [Chloroflexota bacterium]TMC57413.1 MAG: glycine--tRNA ligase [Chloroflexota bacterium]TME41421.1 MAG: glycine--tRNA ligase [Chloroflexota bacterium]
MSEDVADKINSLAKRRGFVFPSSEIYGGAGATWDYGPLGVELKNNVKRAWWRAMVQLRDDIVGIDAAILMHPRVWEASGHVENFIDPLVECGNCRKRFRIDELSDGDALMDQWRDGRADLSTVACPNCGQKKLGPPRRFNLMFKTFVGPVEDTASVAWLRPETAQGIFVNFENVQQSTRRKLPFGIAQVGKSFRNEITPGNFIFRSREFEQMEMQYFCRPADAPRLFDEWLAARRRWYDDLGIDDDLLRFREHAENERAHYAAKAVDIQFRFPFGWQEMEGIHNRTDYDLRRHMEFSGKDLRYFDEATNERFIPHVVETAVGADRATYALLCAAYDEEPDKEGIRVVLRLHKDLAPYKVAVLPLSKNERLTPLAREVYALVRPHFLSTYDETQAIGRRYRRQDEIGTPLCVTIDFPSLDDHAVTIRERDSMAQVRVPIADLVPALREKLGA